MVAFTKATCSTQARPISAHSDTLHAMLVSPQLIDIKGVIHCHKMRFRRRPQQGGVVIIRWEAAENQTEARLVGSINKVSKMISLGEWEAIIARFSGLIMRVWIVKKEGKATTLSLARIVTDK